MATKKASRTTKRRRRVPAGRKPVRLPEPLRRDIAALVLAGVGALGGVALYAGGGAGIVVGLRGGMRVLLGAAAPLLPLAALAAAATLAFGWSGPRVTLRWIGSVLGVVVVVGLLHLGDAGRLWAAAGQGSGGGALGALVDWALLHALGAPGAHVVLGTAAVASALLLWQFRLRTAVVWPARHMARGAGGVGRAVYGFVTEPVPEVGAGSAASSARGRRRLPRVVDVEAGPAAGEDEVTLQLPQPVVLEMPPPEAAAAADARPLPIDGVYQPPPLDLLRKGSRVRSTQGRDSAQRAAQLEEALRSFGIAVRVVAVQLGPTVTRFEVQPGPGVKVARISSLADDIALAMCATDVRIVAPIPGKAAVGIEVPNADVTPVYLRDVMTSRDFRDAASPLTVCIGQDIAGKPVVASLERLLHVLVAGATGSGKSSAINSMLISLLYRAGPEQVRLVLIDPKMVELIQYNGVPHLLAPVVTDPKKAAATLRVVVQEMVKRYGIFSQTGVRNISGYNAVATERGETALPYVVVVIDELADLMLVARAEVEDAIQRLTQMARASGIHLVVATQRPSVDVITGVIKANIPSRIALAVSSQVDSRTIIDGAGAEKLVGRGDMLFRPLGAQKVTRAQGAYVSEAEVERVLSFLRSAGQPEYDQAIMEAEPSEDGAGPGAGGDDELFVDALAVVVESGQASVSNLQRRLRVGFTRAGRLIDMMEQHGYVGPHQGSKSRDVLMTREQFHRTYGDRSAPH